MLSLFTQLHHRLSKPHASIQGAADKITAQFLAMWSFYGALNTPLIYFLWNYNNTEKLSLYFLLGTALMSTIIYPMSRSRYWKSGFWLQCIALWISPSLAIMDLPSNQASYICFIFATIFCAPFINLGRLVAVALCAQCIAIGIWLSPISQANPSIISPLFILTVLQLMTVLLKQYVETLSQHEQATQEAQDLAHIKQLMNTFDIVLVEQDETIVQWSPNAFQELGCTDADFELGFEKGITKMSNVTHHKDSLIVDKKRHYHVYIDQRTSQTIISLRNISHLKDKQLREDTLFKNSALGLLTKGLAHELNNPLMHMTLSLDQLEKKLSSSESPQQHHLQSLHTGLAHIHAITQDLRMLSNGQKVQAICITESLKSTLNLCSTAFKQHKISVTQHLEPEAKVMASSGQLGQIFLNVIQNAIFAMHGRPTKTLTIECQNTAHDVLISFEDTGSGIPENNLKMLFAPHFSTRPPTQGSGMGLYICKQIIEELGGQIDISNTQTGAKISIALPKSQAETATSPLRSVSQETPKPKELSALLRTIAPDSL